ncbi:formylglycine-generating enzyme family protein [Pseudoxanthomonas composti]|nr:formylglycine-generating enzyme family protein [Pseudoxanthomonas composti]
MLELPLRAPVLMLAALLLVSGCEPAQQRVAARQDPAAGAQRENAAQVTVSADAESDLSLNWRPPLTQLAKADLPQARRDAEQAMKQGRLFEEADSAIPLYLSMLAIAPDDARAGRSLERAVRAVLAQGRQAVAEAGDQAAALRRAVAIAAVIRTMAPRVQDLAQPASDYLASVDLAEQLWQLNAVGEDQLRQGQLGEGGTGALSSFRQALQLQPDQPRAMQGLAAVESALIRRAEQAARETDYPSADRWLRLAAGVREPVGTLDDARDRVARIRDAQVAALRDAGIRDLQTPQGLREARDKLAEVLRIAAPGDAVAADFRRRVDLVTHYGLFRPGQVFTDALESGGRGPAMVVVPHGAYRMGAGEDELGATEAEKPAHYVRFERGFAVSRTQVTVGQFRRFIQATGYLARATRRGHSIVYDERSGNFVRRNGADWQSTYSGAPAGDDMPVIHVSVRDADEYAKWLGAQTGRGYRLLSEAEFEYAVRAGRRGRYPWGDSGRPPEAAGNLTGGNDVSPSGRTWNNAFVGYGDGYWGPAPTGRFPPNPWGLRDMGSNVSEWVADCWHSNYRRAPADGAAWYNPGCRARVVRGGSWATSPIQTRAAWRSSNDSDMTSARVGFRVARTL